MEKVLITGASGFVGRRLSMILKESFEIFTTGRKAAGKADSGRNYIQADLTSREQVSILIEEIQPDIIIHAAALSKPDECEVDRENALLINTTATGYLLEAAIKQKSYFVFLSSDFVFDGEKGMYSEEDVPAPVNFYGETKLRAEALVKNYQAGWCIIRTVLVYGSSEGTRENIITSSAKALGKGENIKIVSDQVRTPTHVDDLCLAIKTAIEKKVKGIFHISGRDVMTPYEMVMAAAAYLGLNGDLVTPVTQNTFSQPAKRPLKTGFDISKAIRELDYDPLSFEQGLTKTFESRRGPQRHQGRKEH